MKSFALAVSHAPWIAARVDSMARLRTSLCISVDKDMAASSPVGPYREEKERAPNWHWSRSMWSWLEKQGGIGVTLQDDLVVAPNFWAALDAMTNAHPGKLIDLSSVHPAGKRLAREGRRGYTTTEGHVGLGLLWPEGALREFLGWQRDYLHHDAVEWITEDSLVNLWALTTGRRIYHPVPALIAHDTTMKSLYKNDEHAYRSPAVTWDDGDVCGWLPSDLEQSSFWREESPPHLGSMYKTTAWAARKLVHGFTDAQFAKAQRDRCPQPYARFFTQA